MKNLWNSQQSYTRSDWNIDVVVGHCPGVNVSSDIETGNWTKKQVINSLVMITYC